jgi:branched-chain amino acid transport system substrate-binding protein
VGGGLPALRHAAIVVLLLAFGGLASAAGSHQAKRPVVVAGCDSLYYERAGRPQLVIVSDLPLSDSAHTAMHQMTQAIKLTLKDRGFRAGRYRVGYVVCDDSGPAARWSAKRCVRNARAAVHNPKVVGLIGTLDSGCARVELPVLGAAKVMLVSPLNTAPDLTRLHAGHIARLSASDDAQAEAAAQFLQQQGAETIAARSDGTRRGNAYRSAFASAARRLGLRPVARGRADAAYLGGALSEGTRANLRAARRLAPAGPIVLSAGYGPAAQLAAEIGRPAEGMYLAVAGLPVERLPHQGGRFVTQFETAIGTSPHPYAVYGAQAARVLLDAIAVSNGSRASVGRAVLATRARDELIGSFSFDEHGDPRPAPVTIFRVHNRAAQIVRVVDSGIP